MPDLTDRIISYEDGGLDHEEVIKLFQDLIDTGTIWFLQGHYQRTAQWLLDKGYIHISITEVQITQ